MLYLDYAKPLADGKYILSFFADSVADLEGISHGQKFVTKNGTDYGVPQAGSTVIVISPNSGKTTYVMDEEGIWVVAENISYSAVVANPSDEATAKLEKLKVNDTTYANWTESEIKALAGGSGSEGKLYFKKIHYIGISREIYLGWYSSNNKKEFVSGLSCCGFITLRGGAAGNNPISIIEKIGVTNHNSVECIGICVTDSTDGVVAQIPIDAANSIEVIEI